MFLLIILFDVHTRRFFPSYSSLRPWPGEDGAPGLTRWRSKGNHRTGFDTADEAREALREIAEKTNTPTERVWGDRFLPFDSRMDADPIYTILESAGTVANFQFYPEADLPSLQTADLNQMEPT